MIYLNWWIYFNWFTRSDLIKFNVTVIGVIRAFSEHFQCIFRALSEHSKRFIRTQYISVDYNYLIIFKSIGSIDSKWSFTWWLIWIDEYIYFNWLQNDCLDVFFFLSIGSLERMKADGNLKIFVTWIPRDCAFGIGTVPETAWSMTSMQIIVMDGTRIKPRWTDSTSVPDDIETIPDGGIFPSFVLFIFFFFTTGRWWKNWFTGLEVDGRVFFLFSFFYNSGFVTVHFSKWAFLSKLISGSGWRWGDLLGDTPLIKAELLRSTWYPVVGIPPLLGGLQHHLLLLLVRFNAVDFKLNYN